MLGNFKGLCASTAILLTSVSMAGAAEYVFKLHHFLSPNAPAQTAMLEPWAKTVEENSGGQVKIEIFPSMSLGGRPPELVSQARDGVVDLIWTLNGYTPGLFPRTEVMELPFVYRDNPRAANLALYDMFADDLQADYRGLEVMFLHVHAGNGLHTRNTEVRSPADVEGMRIRTPSRTGAWVIEALGASPAAMSAPELPTALQKGVIDAAFIPWEIIPPLKIHEQTDFQIEGAGNARFGTSVFQVSMNKGRWESLPADIQTAFRDASGPDWWGQVGDIWRAADDFGIGIAVDSGDTHITLTEEETDAFEEALVPVVDRWTSEVSKKGINGTELVAKAQALISKHSE
ncbi:C4-dicarboxylate ABC transporter substrate-binding protein [Pseudovibrio japonicus]|uniref:C4-dicarboxylate ABC transporter substrate-binding protein n=1 Tax=Pseudovibrio japonicus TaxID=366534 RepID=A0ABQ3EHW0_9HYPH|nr:TRAP transporter substrate-binding protein [Pseudovibrio japonicus]GHB40144.1 C4-dicarboxylate ABC transporter substrate-binding protein [Pseudovibrio japonicus]